MAPKKSFRKAYVGIVMDMALARSKISNRMVAQRLGVDETTIRRWRKENIEFERAFTEAREALREKINRVAGKSLDVRKRIRALEVTTDKTTENVLSAVLTLREVLISQTQQITVADKTNMKDGASTSAVLNTGNKTTKPPNTSLLKSITGNAASLLGLG